MHLFIVQRLKMNMLLSIILLLAICKAALGDECGQFEVNDKVFPWNVGIYFVTLNQAELVCLGTVIQPNCVLTAAHCFCENLGENLRNGSFYLLFENLVKTINLKAAPTGLHKINKSNIHVHKHYKGLLHMLENDLVIIKDNFNFSKKVRPVCVDWSTEINDSSKQLKQPIWHSNKIINEDQTDLSSDDCLDAPQPFITFITAEKSCTQPKDKQLHLSHESEGAGLVFQEGARWYIKGVISVHDPTNKQLATYTPVRQYINWISHTC